MDDGGKRHKSGSEPGLVTFAKSVGVVAGAIISAGLILSWAHGMMVVGPLRQERAERITADSLIVNETRASTERLERFAVQQAILQIERPGSPEYRKAQQTLRGLVRYRIGP